MPLYEYRCNACQKEFAVTMSISERAKGHPACPHCGRREVQPLMGTFFAQTSKKS
jgi:putative FmdB family regulatory protein